MSKVAQRDTKKLSYRQRVYRERQRDVEHQKWVSLFREFLWLLERG